MRNHDGQVTKTAEHAEFAEKSNRLNLLFQNGFGTSSWRLAIAPELNNLFFIVQQRLEQGR